MFLAYGASHWAAIAVLAVGAAILVAWGRRHRDTATATRVSRILALAIVVVVVPFQIYVLLPGQWNPRTSLPLQLCDLAWMTAVYALWSRRRWAFALTYYWGLTLTSQAFLTPTLDGRDFPHLDYVMFWGLHLLVVWAAIYLTWGLGLRPDWRGYAIAVAATVGWASPCWCSTTSRAPTTASSPPSHPADRCWMCWVTGRGTCSPNSPSAARSGRC